MAETPRTNRFFIQQELELPGIPPFGTKLFFIVIHGAVALVEGKDVLRAHLIDMGADHRYLVGAWLSESPIAKGLHARLEGDQLASKPPADLDGTKNPLISLATFPDPQNPTFYAVFQLPRPHAIHYFDRGTVQLDGTASLIGTPESLTDTYVLEYELDAHADFTKIHLVEDIKDAKPFWTCGLPTSWSDSFDGGEAASLHIFNSPIQSEVPFEHNQQEFTLGAAALNAANLTIQAPSGASAVDFANPPLPAGLSPLELVRLQSRQVLGDRLAGFLRLASFQLGDAVGGSCRGCCATANGRT